MKPAVSVIVAAYNSEKYIERCLRSVQQQTLREIQLIVIDDGSDDATGEIADRLLSDDTRSCVVHQENCGVSAARNAGITLAEGEYLFFCDADDWLEADALATLYGFGKDNNLDVVYFDHYRDAKTSASRIRLFPSAFVSTDDTSVVGALRAASLYVPSSRFKTRFFDRILYGGGAAWKYLTRRRIVLSGGARFDPYLDGMMEDALFTFDMLGSSRAIGYLDVPLYHYAVHDESTIHRYVPDCRVRFERVINRMEQRLAEHPDGTYIADAVQMRVVEFVGKMCEMNLCNPNNPASASERYGQFLSYVKDERVSGSIRGVKLTRLANRRVRILTILLKLHLYRLYWIIKENKKYK